MKNKPVAYGFPVEKDAIAQTIAKLKELGATDTFDGLAAWEVGGYENDNTAASVKMFTPVVLFTFPGKHPHDALAALQTEVAPANRQGWSPGFALDVEDNLTIHAVTWEDTTDSDASMFETATVTNFIRHARFQTPEEAASTILCAQLDRTVYPEESEPHHLTVRSMMHGHDGKPRRMKADEIKYGVAPQLTCFELAIAKSGESGWTDTPIATIRSWLDAGESLDGEQHAMMAFGHLARSLDIPIYYPDQTLPEVRHIIEGHEPPPRLFAALCATLGAPDRQANTAAYRVFFGEPHTPEERLTIIAKLQDNYDRLNHSIAVREKNGEGNLHDAYKQKESLKTVFAHIESVNETRTTPISFVSQRSLAAGLAGEPAGKVAEWDADTDAHRAGQQLAEYKRQLRLADAASGAFSDGGNHQAYKVAITKAAVALALAHDKLEKIGAPRFLPKSELGRVTEAARDASIHLSLYECGRLHEAKEAQEKAKTGEVQGDYEFKNAPSANTAAAKTNKR